MCVCFFFRFVFFFCTKHDILTFFCLLLHAGKWRISFYLSVLLFAFTNTCGQEKQEEYRAEIVFCSWFIRA